jgi:hypothetical protein
MEKVILDELPDLEEPRNIIDGFAVLGTPGPTLPQP